MALITKASSCANLFQKNFKICETIVSSNLNNFLNIKEFDFKTKARTAATATASAETSEKPAQKIKRFKIYRWVNKFKFSNGDKN